MWNKVVIVCCLIIFACGANGNPFDVEAKIYENKILEMLENLRLRMCYSEPGGLPQLEPLNIKNRIDFNLQKDATRIKGFVKNLKVEGLSKFLIDYLSFTITLKFNFTMSLPKLVISGDYGLDANVGGFFKVGGIGPFRFELEGFQLKAGAAFVYKERLMLKGLQLGPKLEGFLAEVENLSADDYVTQFLNNVASASVPQIINEHISSGTMESIQEYLEEMVSGLLSDLTVNDLLGLISGSNNPFPPLDPEKACKIDAE